MIKKFLTVLVLGLAVFAVSCSSDKLPEGFDVSAKSASVTLGSTVVAVGVADGDTEEITITLTGISTAEVEASAAASAIDTKLGTTPTATSTKSFLESVVTVTGGTLSVDEAAALMGTGTSTTIKGILSYKNDSDKDVEVELTFTINAAGSDKPTDITAPTIPTTTTVPALIPSASDSIVGDVTVAAGASSPYDIEITSDEYTTGDRNGIAAAIVALGATMDVATFAKLITFTAADFSVVSVAVAASTPADEKVTFTVTGTLSNGIETTVEVVASCNGTK